MSESITSKRFNVSLRVRPEISLAFLDSRVLTLLGMEMVIWGGVWAIRSAIQSGMAQQAARDPMWAASASLTNYWLGVALVLVGLLFSYRMGLVWQGAGVALVGVLTRGLPMLVSGLPFGRDAYMHWGSVMMVQNAGYIMLTAPPHTYLSMPFFFAGGAVEAIIAQIQSVEQAIPILVAWQFILPALTALMGLLIAERLTADPLLRIVGALALSVASPFYFVQHWSPLSLAVLFLWALIWLAFLPSSRSKTWLMWVVVLAFVLVHPFLPLLYWLLIASARIVDIVSHRLPFFRTRNFEFAWDSPFYLTIVSYLAWQLYAARDFSLRPGLTLITNFIHNILTLGALQSVHANLSGQIPQTVSTLRWSIFIVFTLLACLVALVDFIRNRRITIFFIWLLLAEILTAVFAASGVFYMFVLRALPLAVPFAALTVLSSDESRRFKWPLIVAVLVAVPLATIAGHWDGPERITLPADLAGLRYASQLVRSDFAVLVEPDFRGFRSEAVGHYPYEEVTAWRPDIVDASDMVVLEQGFEAFVADDGEWKDYQKALDRLGAGWSQVYDNGRIRIYDRTSRVLRGLELVPTGTPNVSSPILLHADTPAMQLAVLGAGVLISALLGLFICYALFADSLSPPQVIGVVLLLVILIPGITGTLLGLTPIHLSQTTIIIALAVESIAAVAAAVWRFGWRGMNWLGQVVSEKTDYVLPANIGPRLVLAVLLVGSIIGAMSLFAKGLERPWPGYATLSLMSIDSRVATLTVTNEETEARTYLLLVDSVNRGALTEKFVLAPGEQSERKLLLPALNPGQLHIALYREGEAKPYRELQVHLSSQ